MLESSEECLLCASSRSDQAEIEYLAASCATDCCDSQKSLPKMQVQTLTNTHAFTRFDVERYVMKDFRPVLMMKRFPVSPDAHREDRHVTYK